MGSLGFLKRMLPFLATFTLGVFIASFFVSIAVPSLGNRGPGRKFHHMKRLRVENERLRNENLRLRNELESVRQSSWHNPGHAPEIQVNGENFLQAPPAPPAPVAPRAVK